MRRKPYRFITNSYRLISVFLIGLPVIITVFMFWYSYSDYLLTQNDKHLKYTAESILNVVRMRFDLVYNYLFQEEHYIKKNLNDSADIIHRLAREFELEVARKHFSDSRAKDLFLSLVADINSTGEYSINLIDSNDKILTHTQLPKRFDVNKYEWVLKMREQETGTLRYTWQFPGEAEARERLASFRLLHGWNWLMTLEAETPDPEKSDFADKQIQGLNDFVTGYHSSTGGYGMILSVEDYSIISHPEFSQGPINQITGYEKLIETRNGVVTFNDERGNAWRAGVVYYTPKQWLIIVTAQEAQILATARSQLLKITVVSGVLFLIALLMFFRANRSLLASALAETRKQPLLGQHILDDRD